MLKIVSTSQIRDIDRIAINDYGIPETILMENAGLEAIRFLEESYGSLNGRRVGVFCGKGNNGGDGFVIARHLLLMGVEVEVYLLADSGSLKGNAGLNMEIFRKIGGEVKECQTDAALGKLGVSIRHADILVDAILGIGITSELKGIYKTAVEKINKSEGFCFSVDIPTGLCSDRGAVFGLHVKADATVTFGFPKTGMVFHPAVESVGQMKAVNISFPLKLLEISPCDAYLLDGDWVSKRLSPPPPSAHKGAFGHAVITGGSPGMGGAVGLASLAALKVGAGLSTAAVSEELAGSFELGMPEVMSFPLGKGAYDPSEAQKLIQFADKKSALLIGPGMGRGGSRTDFIDRIVSSVEVPIVIDADGLYNVADKPDILKKAKSPIMVTPHPGEMARLTGSSVKEINENRLQTASEFSNKYNCIMVLKGARTVIAEPGGKAYVNPTGNPNLGSGGTGDVLSGMIAGFLAKGFEPAEAACIAVYLHGLAADIYTEENDPFSMSASNLLDYISVSISSLTDRES